MEDEQEMNTDKKKSIVNICFVSKEFSLHSNELVDNSFAGCSVA